MTDANGCWEWITKPKSWLALIISFCVTGAIAMHTEFSSVLADWVQAIGSVAAISASLYVVNLQHEREKRLAKEEELFGIYRKINMITAVVNDARGKLFISPVWMEALRKGERVDYNCLDGISQSIKVLDQIHIYDLREYDAVRQFLGFKTLLSDAHYHIEQIEKIIKQNYISVNAKHDDYMKHYSRLRIIEQDSEKFSKFFFEMDKHYENKVKNRVSSIASQ